MTPPSTQNLKALDLWVFFLIYCSTFSFIPNVGFRLTLEYLTISPSSESLFSTLIHSPFERKHSQPEYITYDPSLVTNNSDTTCWENPRGKHWGDLYNENWAKPISGMTPPSTQNLKALSLWVLFLIYCSTFSFLPNVGLRLTLEYLTILDSFLPNVELRLTLKYLTISPSSVSLSSTTLIHFPSSGSILNPSTLLMAPHLYRRSYTYTGHACLKSPSGRLLIQSQTILAQAANQRLWYHLLRESEGEIPGRSLQW